MTISVGLARAARAASHGNPWHNPKWTRRRAALAAGALALVGNACGSSPLEGLWPPGPRGSRLDRPLRLAVEDARIEYLPDERAWLIATADLEERLELRPYNGIAPGDGRHRLVRAYLRARARNIRAEIGEDGEEGGEANGATPGGVLGISFVDDREPALVPLDYRVERTTDGSLLLSIRLRSAREELPAEFHAEARIRPHRSVVEHRSRVRNLGRNVLHLSRLDSAGFVLRGAPFARWQAAILDTGGHVWLSRLGRDGVLAAETPPLSAERQPVVPFLALYDSASDEGLVLALRWSSNYRLVARSLGEFSAAVDAGVRLQGGGITPEARAAEAALATDPPGLRLAPGTTLESPWLLIGLFDGGLDAAGNALREYLMETRPREPGWARDVLPVGWNSWFAYGPGVDYQSMREEARLAREVGADVFYVDYGWSAALGDWVPDPQAFPRDTLIRLSDEVRRLGMRFGLWVAFGVADPDSQLVRRHPEFVAQQPQPPRLGIDESLPLCLTQARGWVEPELDRIVRSYKLDWLKFDQPMIAACLAENHGHPPTVRGSLYANNAAFYAILDGLRERWPRLFIESTFDGPGYLDFGVYARSHATWLDDNAGIPSVPMPQVQRLLHGATLAFPARFLTSWVARPPEGQVPFAGEEELPPGRGLAPADLAYQAYSTMGGSWGISLQLRDLDDEQRTRLRQLVEIYKSLRELLPGAEVYHLAPALAPSVPLGPGRVVPAQEPDGDAWFVLQYVQPDVGRSALLAVRNGPQSPAQLRVRLQGLAPNATYVATWDDGTTVERGTGAELLTFGLVLRRRPYSGGIVWLSPEPPGATGAV